MFTDLISEFQEDITAVESFADEIYDKEFASFFQLSHDLHNRVTNKKKPVTDSELEEILTTVPLNMIQISERLNKYRTALDVIRTKMKAKRRELVKESSGVTKTEREEDANAAMAEYEIICIAYTNIIQRVDNQISFSRELVMCAKKLWDARHARPVNPVSEATATDKSGGKYSTETLPEYIPTAYEDKMYIK